MAKLNKMPDNRLIHPVCVTEERLVYNPKLLLEKPLAQQVFLLLHEIIHVVNRHHVRCEGRTPLLWNIATDFCVNSLLLPKIPPEIRDNLMLPDTYGLPFGKAAEWYYQNIQNIKFDLGSIPSHSYWAEPQSPNSFDAITPVLAKEALPRLVSRFIRSSLSANKVRSKRKLSRRNPAAAGKARKREEATLIIAIDTSASIQAQAIDSFVSNIKNLCQKMACQILVIEADSCVQKTYSLREKDTLNIQCGNETKLSPALKEAQKLSRILNIGCLIYFTDGETSEEFVYKPSFPVIWAYPQKYSKPVEWGQHVCLG